MRINKVKSLWQEGKAPTVAWLDTADTYVAESMANVGFDALITLKRDKIVSRTFANF